jgi:hypothetical protein
LTRKQVKRGSQARRSTAGLIAPVKYFACGKTYVNGSFAITFSLLKLPKRLYIAKLKHQPKGPASAIGKSDHVT